MNECIVIFLQLVSRFGCNNLYQHFSLVPAGRCSTFHSQFCMPANDEPNDFLLTRNFGARMSNRIYMPNICAVCKNCAELRLVIFEDFAIATKNTSGNSLELVFFTSKIIRSCLCFRVEFFENICGKID